MNGILLINKPKGVTSRDVVNMVSKKLNTRKVGHAGTLDPLATGLLIIGVNKGTKVLDLLTLNDKEYIAVVKLGVKTDTFDIDGKVILEKDNFSLDIDKLKNVLNSFKGTYLQEVPSYSAVKVNGKKLYEYARNNIEVSLPKREVTIFDIELLSFSLDEFVFRALVSKGTYIRSLINDIGDKLNIPCTMKELKRIKSGKFKLEDSVDVNNIEDCLKIEDCVDFTKVKLVDANIIKKVKNGCRLEFDLDDEYISLLDNDDNLLAIYQKENKIFKPYKVF